MNRDKLIATIYAERDFGRSIATTVAGVVGLTTYLFSSDWIIALFAAVIAFPVCRVTASALHSRWKQNHAQIVKKIEAAQAFSRFSPQERQVIEFFVRSGGACVSWGAVNRSDLPFPRAAVNSLIERGVVRLSVMEDLMTEAFALDIDTFDTAQEALGGNREAEPEPARDSKKAGRLDDDLPF
ncbi:MAG: hypothetical protein KAW17_12980 [Candidatus Eisenbacteria sp.]|nr:hypothetical protein [Candidatus Eisenbacteria bacterium]